MRMNSDGNTFPIVLTLCAMIAFPIGSSAAVLRSFNAIGFATECEGEFCQTLPISGRLRYLDPNPGVDDSLVLCDPADITIDNPIGCVANTSLFLKLDTGPELSVPLVVGDNIALRIALEVREIGNAISVELDAAYCGFFDPTPPPGPRGCDGSFWRIRNQDDFSYDSGHGEVAIGHVGWISEPPAFALFGLSLVGLFGTAVKGWKGERTRS